MALVPFDTMIKEGKYSPNKCTQGNWNITSEKEFDGCSKSGPAQRLQVDSGSIMDTVTTCGAYCTPLYLPPYISSHAATT